MLCKNFINELCEKMERKKWLVASRIWAVRFVSWGKHKRAMGVKKQIPRQALPEICQERLGWTVLSRNCKEQNITVLPFRDYTRVECKCKLFSTFHWSFPDTHPLKNHAMTTCRYLYYSPLHWYFHEPIYSLNAITRHVLYLFMIQYSLIVLNVTTARFMVQMTYLKTKKITTHKRLKKKWYSSFLSFFSELTFSWLL